MHKKNTLFETEILIQVSDINLTGHLGNDRFLTLAQEARTRWLRSLGWSEKNVAHSDAGIMVVKAQIQFLKQAFLGQTLIAKLHMGTVGPCTLNLFCELIEKKQKQLVGRIETKLVFFNYSKQKIVRCPKEIVALRGSHE